jgi:amino acid transporter
VVFIGAMDPAELGKGFGGITNPLITAGPFAGVAALAGLGVWATILRIDAFVSPFGTGLIYQTSTSRVGYGLARNRYFPQIFQAVDRNGVPWFSLIMAFVFGLFFLLPFPSWQSLVGLITSASVLMYAGAPLSLGDFRRKLPDAVRPYRMPAAAFLSPLAFIIANMLIYWSGFVVVWKLGACLVIGYILIGIAMAFDVQRPPLQWKSAQWLLPYLIGMGIISWLGQFPLKGDGGAPPINTFHIPFWWDILVVVVFSLVIYYWAMNTGLSREETLDLVARQSGQEELPDTGLHH